MSQEKKLKSPTVIAQREIKGLMNDYHAFTLQQQIESEARLCRLRERTHSSSSSTQPSATQKLKH